MINEQQQELASLFAVGALTAAERAQFESDLAANPELHAFVRDLQRTAELLVSSSARPPAQLKGKVLARIDALEAAQRPSSIPVPAAAAGLRFEDGASQLGWKSLPVTGAYIKLLSLEREHGYAVLMGKLDPGTRYPAHVNVGPEDFCILATAGWSQAIFITPTEALITRRIIPWKAVP
jgi:hypothetical protein